MLKIGHWRKSKSEIKNEGEKKILKSTRGKQNHLSRNKSPNDSKSHAGWMKSVGH